MEEGNFTRRTRQACEPCRRKKSRCPGEKPTCSYCERLGQQCEYRPASDTHGDSQARHNRKMEHRLGNLEGQLSRLIQHLSPEVLDSRRLSSSSGQAASPGPSRTTEEAQAGDNTGDITILANDHTSDDQLQETGQLYLKWCHGQPLSLFDPDTFLDSLQSRDEELLYCLRALTGRFPPGSLTPEKRDSLDLLATSARRLVMNRIADSEMELSTLQSLCILSMIDFMGGRVSQSGLNLVIADHMRQTLQGSCGADELTKERQLCFLSISVLHKLQGSVVASVKMMQSPSFATFSMVNPSWASSDETDYQPDGSISTYAAKLCGVWHMARAYATSRVQPNSPPPWDPRSGFSGIMNGHLHLDCLIPLKYRFNSNNMAECDTETLHRQRDYWSAFLFIQFVYSAIPCLLNHPFLLSMRLRHFRHTIPQSFIQTSYEQITRCMGWIVYFIDLLEQKSFQVSDPTLAHCVAIVSTIHLQHSFVKNRELRRKATQGFEKCMRFLERMGSIWPAVAIMAENLKKLQQSVVVVPLRQGGDAISPDDDQPAFSIDSRLLWDVLIYERAGQPNAGKDESMLGKTLAKRTTSESRDADAEYDLIGSAGISGHKAVMSQGPVYAPDEENSSVGTATMENPLEFIPHQQVIPEMGFPIGDVYLDGVGGCGDQENMFIQANDYGRAIGDWFDFDAV